MFQRLTEAKEVISERSMKNKELAKIFSRIADAIEFKGGDRFRIVE